MDRLTESAPFPLEQTFLRCQLCGMENDDICHFWLWYECDEDDQPEKDKILITCRGDDCHQIIEDHDRLYYQPEWGRGKPGSFMLVCGDCEHRDGGKCNHPDLKENGGGGLLVNFAGNVPVIHINYGDGRGKFLGPPAIRCVGNPEEEKR